jgi:molecular chaperone DnaK
MPAPRGIPKIEVIFDIDANGILNVTAKDQATGKEQKIRIEASSGLSKDEIEKMKAEAKANEDADKAEKEKIEKINAADTMIFQTEKQLKEYGDKLSAANKTALEDALAALRQAHSNKDVAGIDAALEKLNAAWQQASTEMYQNTGGEANASNGSANAGKDTDVTDAEFEEVK